MKKILAILLACLFVFAMTACKNNKPTEKPTEAPTTAAPTTAAPTEPAVTVMSHADYIAAAVDDPVVVEMYVQDTQSWWDNKITVYGADKDGGYFCYNMACSQEDAAKLTPGTKIRVTGFRAEWAGEIEVAADATFEFVDGDSYVAEAKDLTELLGKDELIQHQNERALFKGLKVTQIGYKNDPGTDDIYVNVEKDGAEYAFCVEYYLRNNDTDVYKAVQALNVGDVVDIETYLYWYEGPNPHIIGVNVTEAAPAVMSHAEFVAAEVDDPVVVEMYVQDHQSWWDNKITVYGADKDGGYFCYNMACSEEDAAKLTPGTKIRVTGFRAEWAGEIEIAENATFEFVKGDSYIAEAEDVTELLGKDELAEHMNELVLFKGLTVKEVTFKNDPGTDDAYLAVTLDGADYSFCVEYYLRNNETDVYKTVQQLQPGQVIDVTCYLYWYNGPNPHVIDVKVVE